jgi:hypothetical protein
MNRALLLALVLTFSSAGYGGSYFPKSIILDISQPVEIYHLSADCWYQDYDGQDPSQYWGVYMNKTTDLSIRDSGDYCSFHTSDVTTSCEEDMQPYMDVISESGICALRTHSHSPGQAGGEALCRGSRSSVINIIHELCSMMLTVE